MSPAQKRTVYLSLTAALVVLFVAGLLTGYVGRHTPLCADGKLPTGQQDVGIGQVRFRCHNGQIVTSNN
jgi:hypothetical protein